MEGFVPLWQRSHRQELGTPGDVASVAKKQEQGLGADCQSACFLCFIQSRIPCSGYGSSPH